MWLLVGALLAAQPSFAEDGPPPAPSTAAPPPPSSVPATPGEGPADGGDKGDAPPGENGAAPAEAPSEDEMKALMDALGQDAAARDEKAAPAETSASSKGPLDSVGPALASMGRMIQSMNPDLSLILDVAVAGFSAEQNYQTGGHDPRVTGFNLQQLEMHLEASVDPFFRMDANIVFSQFGVEVEEAYATSTSLPAGLQLRGGQFLTRFGRLNNTHPHSWHFVDQPLVNGKFFGSEGSRGLGAELSWLSPLPWYAEVLVSATEAKNACCARSFYGADDLGVRSPLDVVYTAALKQFFPFGDDLSLNWGLSYQGGPNATGVGNRTEIYGTDLYLRYRPVDDPGRLAAWVVVESMARRRQVPFAVLADYGGYAEAVVQFALQYELGARAEVVTGVDDDPLDPDWSGARTRYSAAFTYYPSHFSRLRVQAAYGASDDGEGALLSTLYDRPVFAVFAALEVLIGAHGSHGF